ncbi:hypothetical protein [Thiosocius teredinicola]
MEIALLVFLFLIGTVASAIQALKYLERRQGDRQAHHRSKQDSGE